MIKFHDSRAEKEKAIKEAEAKFRADLKAQALPRNVNDWGDSDIVRILEGNGGIRRMLLNPVFRKKLAELAKKKRVADSEEVYFSKLVYMIEFIGYEPYQAFEVLSPYMASDFGYSPDYLKGLWDKTRRDKPKLYKKWQDKFTAIEGKLSINRGNRGQMKAFPSEKLEDDCPRFDSAQFLKECGFELWDKPPE